MVMFPMSADATEYIAGLNRLVLSLHTQTQVTEALAYARVACQAASEHLPENHPVALASLNNLASMLQATGNHGEAQLLFQRVLTIRRASVGDDHPDVAISLNNLAGLHLAMGDTHQAIALFENALNIWQKAYGDSHHTVRRCFQSLAAAHFQVHEYAAAAMRLEQVHRQEVAGGPDYVATVKRLALVYHEMGDYGQELPFRQQLLTIARSSPSASLDPGVCLNNLAAVQYNLGQFALAAHLYREAVDQAQSAGKELPLASRLNNLAALLRSIGDYAQAEALYRQALALLAASPASTAKSLTQTRTNLGELLVATMRYDEARSIYMEALEPWRENGGEDNLDIAATLNNLAQLEALQENLYVARDLYSQALTIFRRVCGERHPAVASGLINIAETHKATGEYPLAEPLLEEALSIQRAVYTGFHPAVPQSLMYLAQLRAAMGNQPSAISLLQEAAAIDGQMIGEIFSFGSERQRMEYVATLHARFDVSLSLFALLAPTNPQAILAGLDLCFHRKALGAEALAVQRDAVFGNRHPALIANLRELTRLRARIAQALLYEAAPGDAPSTQQLVDAWNMEKDRLEAALAEQIPEMDLAERLRAADARSVAESLPRGSILVEFVRWAPYRFDSAHAPDHRVWQQDRYLAFVLPAGHAEEAKMVDLGECAHIDNAINTWRVAVARARTEDVSLEHGARHLKASKRVTQDTNLLAEGQYLRQLVFDPLLTAVHGHARLFLATDGELARLPFEILPLGPDRHLIDEFTISYLSTGRDTLRLSVPHVGKPEPPLVIADPDYDLTDGHEVRGQEQSGEELVEGALRSDLQRDYLRFGQLPGTRAEGELVGRILGVQPTMGAAAVKARVKACRSPRIMHFGVHGFFLSNQRSPADGAPVVSGYGPTDERIRRLATLENPYLRSGLALAGANTWLAGGDPPSEAENGLLTAEDIAGLDLLDTDLVVLSACETGLGEIRAGEGVLGMCRAFAIAGARALIVSLWQVPDHPTYLLMATFYERLLAGEPCAIALRSAQQALRHTFPHPYFWGAFICQGDGDLSFTDAMKREAAV